MNPHQIDRVEPLLKALANRNRLQLLVHLQEPRRLSEIELAPTREDSWGDSDRPISRQAVRRHLSVLEEIGVVARQQAGDDTLYVVDHAALFVLTEELRTLATVKPQVEAGGNTAHLTRAPTFDRVAGHQLILVRGVGEGRSFPLDGEAPNEGWTIGRSAKAEVPVDYDPYVSSAQARILPRKGRMFLVDLEANRNTTLLNWEPMVPGGIAPLSTGDLIGVGMSLLMYHAGAASP